MAGLGPSELLIVLAVLIFLFGARKLPDLANSLGRSIKEFRHATDEPPRPDEPRSPGVASRP